MKFEEKIRRFLCNRDTPVAVTWATFAIVYFVDPEGMTTISFGVVLVLNTLLIGLIGQYERIRQYIFPSSEELKNMLLEGKERFQKATIAILTNYIAAGLIFYLRPASDSTVINSMFLTYIVFTCFLSFDFVFFVREIQKLSRKKTI